MASHGVLGVIPARYGSTRFPGKPLAYIKGEPMILRVMKRAERIEGIDRVVVATDDIRIRDIVAEAGGKALVSERKHETGTSRVAEAAADIASDIVINIQGDEPLLPIEGVQKLVRSMREDPSIHMATLASYSEIEEEKNDRDIVKAVFDLEGNALYFSRSPVPYSGKGFFRHVGIYGYRREFLISYSGLPRGPLEKSESLEQLRALENGFVIKVITCKAVSCGVDKPEDIKRVEKLIDRV